MIRTTESSEHEEASSPKRPHEAESGTSITALVQSPMPRVSGQWRSRARRRIHRSPFASRAKSTLRSMGISSVLYLQWCTSCANDSCAAVETWQA